MLTRLTAVLCGLVLLAGVATAAYDYGTAQTTTEVIAPPGSPGSLDFLEEIIQAVKGDAVRAPEDEELVRGAVDGLLEVLEDPYARYYNEAAFEDLNTMLDGGFSGIGVVLEETPEGLVVVSVFANTPAAEAGMEQGERIISVNGKPVEGRPIDVVVEEIKGEEGTSVTLGLTGGSQGTRELTMTRKRIELPNVEAELLDDGNGYVRLLQFTSGVGDKVRREVDRLVGEGAKGIVLDLRDNPGGLLNEAVNVASVFIERGAIVEVAEREEPRRTYRAKGDAIEGLPLVVLVNRGSASASEIVAGAVQDTDRGTLIGQTTFGKGTVQTIHRLDAGGGVKYTTAEYFTPSGDSIEDVGVEPDRKVTGADAQLEAAQRALQAAIAEGAPAETG